MFAGHKCSISILEFDKKGKYLASYSSFENELYIWKIGNLSIVDSFTNIFGFKETFYKKFFLPPQSNAERISLKWSADDKKIEVFSGNVCFWTQVMEIF